MSFSFIWHSENSCPSSRPPVCHHPNACGSDELIQQTDCDGLDLILRPLVSGTWIDFVSEQQHRIPQSGRMLRSRPEEPAGSLTSIGFSLVSVLTVAVFDQREVLSPDVPLPVQTVIVLVPRDHPHELVV